MITPAGTTAAPRAAWPLSCSMPPMAALLSAPAAARGYVSNVLASWGMSALADVTELVISELVANAVGASTDRLTGGRSTSADGSPLSGWYFSATAIR